jgi:hypothetical protein
MAARRSWEIAALTVTLTVTGTLLSFLARKERGDTRRTAILWRINNWRLCAGYEDARIADHKNRKYPKNESTLTENHGVPGSNPGLATSFFIEICR